MGDCDDRLCAVCKAGNIMYRDTAFILIPRQLGSRKDKATCSSSSFFKIYYYIIVIFEIHFISRLKSQLCCDSDE